MGLLSLPISERLECLQELLSCTGKMYLWTYDSSGKLLETSCPDRVLNNVFSSTGCMGAVLRHAEEHCEPLVISIPYGLSWSAAFETENDQLEKIHVLGPVCSIELSYAAISKMVQSAKISHHWRPKFIQILQRIPIVSNIDFFRQTLMLHYCISGEQLTVSDITFLEPSAARAEKADIPKKDRIKTYMAEQALMRMISEGDLNYKNILQEASLASQGVQTAEIGSLEQIKVTQIVFISLCTRAAIQGGISPEIAYSRGDAYIQDVLDCKTMADATHIGHTMYDDFVHMVHKGRTNPNYSKYIQSCCDYIELHAEDKISLSDIAKNIGYSDYYLSRKFKEETGHSINDYIKFVKIERAKTLLLATDMSIQDICDQLNFGTRSFFAETFKEIAGIPPAAFREKNLHV